MKLELGGWRALALIAINRHRAETKHSEGKDLWYWVGGCWVGNEIWIRKSGGSFRSEIVVFKVGRGR